MLAALEVRSASVLCLWASLRLPSRPFLFAVQRLWSLFSIVFRGPRAEARASALLFSEARPLSSLAYSASMAVQFLLPIAFAVSSHSTSGFDNFDFDLC